MSDVSTPPRTLVLVAGSGRSGTSLLAGLTSRLGCHIPLPEVVADESNPRGFGEPKWAVDFHKGLLGSMNIAGEDGRPRAWEIASQVTRRVPAHARLKDWLSEQFESSDRVVVKDPRLAWFVPLYLDVADAVDARVVVVTMLRHPAESIKSREIAYGTKTTPPTRMAGWLNLMLGTERTTRELPRALVRYDDLLDDWQGALTDVERQTAAPLLSVATPEQVADADALVDRSLRRATPEWGPLGLSPALQDLAERAYAALRVTDTSALDELSAEYAEMYTAAEALSRSSIRAARVQERRKVTRELKDEAGQTEGRLSRLLGRGKGTDD